MTPDELKELIQKLEKLRSMIDRAIDSKQMLPPSTEHLLDDIEERINFAVESLENADTR